jgi:hypothetical protein
MRTGYDSVTPGAIPAAANSPSAVVFGYTDGNVSEWPTAAWDGWPHARKLRIDATGADPFASDILDVTDGLGNALARRWAGERAAKGWTSALYAQRSDEAALRAEVAGIPHVSYWIADWSLKEAEAAALVHGDVVAVQWASPSSNGLAGYDLSVVSDSWFPAAQPAPVPAGPTHEQVTQALATLAAFVARH